MTFLVFRAIPKLAIQALRNDKVIQNGKIFPVDRRVSARNHSKTIAELLAELHSFGDLPALNQRMEEVGQRSSGSAFVQVYMAPKIQKSSQNCRTKNES